MEASQDEAERDRHQEVCGGTAKGVDEALACGADAVWLHRHLAAPTDQRHEYGDDADGLQEAPRVEGEVAEIADRAIALEVRRRSVPHLVDRNRDQQRR